MRQVLGSIEGLSPRVRGNRPGAAQRWHPRGSIPACAGEPYLHCRLRGSVKVYPRVCGGTYNGGTMSVSFTGLSPRVRGNLRGSRGQTAGRGSIPACAGEPSKLPQPAPRGQVYPRVCGGTTARMLQCPGKIGLSPRVRGNPITPLSVAPGARSIPACAGEPWRTPAGMTRIPVYPRVCGGTFSIHALGGVEPGLSPRVRGNPRCNDGR